MPCDSVLVRPRTGVPGQIRTPTSDWSAKVQPSMAVDSSGYRQGSAGNFQVLAHHHSVVRQVPRQLEYLFENPEIPFNR